MIFCRTGPFDRFDPAQGKQTQDKLPYNGPAGPDDNVKTTQSRPHNAAELEITTKRRPPHNTAGFVRI